ncbi:hypothetical protein B0H14DRAFT_3508352 [Mycena olivaceomarginata]|nr:hypothetical protein B0H14DRAFT_3508352 [Mycena olivaceomarginata]
MGNITSRQLDLHCFLGLTVCYSTTIDPRYLEHHSYTYWTGDIAALIVGGKLKCCLIAPQFPIYVSPKEALGPNTSFGSGRTKADGEAQGVYVDIAIVMPIIQPRYVEELGKFGKDLDKKSLHDFLEDPQNLQLSPRCLWVSGFEQCIILLAGAREYYRIRWVTRGWAAKKLNGEPYSAATLKVLKRAGEEFNDGDSDSELDYTGSDSDLDDAESEEKLHNAESEEELDDDDGNWTEGDEMDVDDGWTEGRMDEMDDAVDDGDWTEAMMDEMYGDPLDACNRQQRLNTQHTHRHLEREARRQKYVDALNTLPSQDRTAPLFSEEALNTIHLNQVGRELFQSISPEEYFKSGGTGGTTKWSNILRLGSTLSNQYMVKIQNLIHEHEILEEARRNKVFFTKVDNIT